MFAGEGLGGEIRRPQRGYRRAGAELSCKHEDLAARERETVDA
jgi:hypothetical protein